MGTIKLKNASENMEEKTTAVTEKGIEVADQVADNTARQEEVPQKKFDFMNMAGALYEDTSLRSEHTKCWRMNNGTMKQIISENPLHDRDENGNLCEIDNTLTDSGEVYETPLTARKISFAKDAAARNLMRIQKKGMDLTWHYCRKPQHNTAVMRMCASPIEADDVVTKTQKGVVYENIEQGVDLQYELLGSNVKENIVVKEKREEYRFEFLMDTKGLSVELSEDQRSIELYSSFTNAAGQTERVKEYTIPEPFMYDATGARNDEVYYEMEKLSDTEYRFAVVAEPSWINGDARVLPVTIDPQLVTRQSYLFSAQVQSQTCSDYYWTNENSNYMRVSYDYFLTYKTVLTIHKSNFPLSAQKVISKVIMRLTAQSVSGSGSIYSSRGSIKRTGNIFELDLTSAFNSASDSFNVELYPSGYINATLYKTTNPPVFEVEYLLNEAIKPCKKQIDLADGFTGMYDIATGELVAEFPHISCEGMSLDYGISHIFKKSAETFHCGNNCRLNLHERLDDNGSSAYGKNYIYTDPYGEKYGFNEYFYYIDSNKQKQDVGKASVTVATDGSLSYGDYEVFREVRSATGLKVVTKLEGVKNVEYYEQRQEELKQLEEQVESYENALNDFMIIDKAEGSTLCHISKNVTLSSPYSFALFAQNAKAQNHLLLTEGDSLSYKSILQQYDSVIHQQEVAETADIRADLKKQEHLLDEQIVYMLHKNNANVVQLERYYKEYLAKSEELKQRKRYTPVSYLSDGDIIKGFNENGWLVAIFDAYENTLMLERDDKNRITRIVDDKEKQITFEYNAAGNLACVTDVRGRRTQYTYASQYVKTITMPSGKTFTLSFSDSLLTNVVSSNKVSAYMVYSGMQLQTLYYRTSADTITKEGATGNTTRNCVTTTFAYGAKMTTISTSDGLPTKETYKFDTVGNLTEYYVEENGLVIKAERYAYEKYAYDKTRCAKRGSLYTAWSNLSSIIPPFTTENYDGDYTYIALDKFNNPTQEIVHNEMLGNIDTSRKDTVTEYTYDENHRVIKEVTKISTYKMGIKAINAITYIAYNVKTYYYNSLGRVVRTESYMTNEGTAEALSPQDVCDAHGKTIEETVYDEKGRAIKSFTYNSLDTSSKFYTESEYDESGKVTAELDETGENKTKFEYADGTDIVRTQVLPNGSKFSYGHDENDIVTAITQSTEEGEENSTQTAYTCGEVTELRSGNNKVNYAYDYKRRLTAVDLNGTENYVKFAYTDKTTETVNGESVTVNKTKATYIKRDATKAEDVFETASDLRGNVVRTSYNGATVTSATYDARSNLTKLADSDTGSTATCTYDPTFNRITSYAFTPSANAKVPSEKVTEQYGYGIEHNLTSKTLKIGDAAARTYSYGYDKIHTRDLESITVDGIKVLPQSDCLGRNTGKNIEVSGAKVASEQITYRKVGDHATNMPSAMRFGNHIVTGTNKTEFVRLDNLKYKYDSCGNITEIHENGALAARYTYDKLNRLIREDNKQLKATTLFTYDNNGNILSKRAFAFTLKDTALLEELSETQNIQYAYSGDKLLSFGNELCAYDALGNPVMYRGKTCVWEKGRQLAEYNGIEFKYDGQGKRYKKGNILFTYDRAGNLIKQSNGLEFLYDNTGVMGVKHTVGNSTYTYLYRKDAQGNVIALLDSTGKVVVKYVYDAWGNHAVLNPDGSDLTSLAHIGNLNPFRYCGYYYDTETELYYLQTRYYDPETSRFITIDDISYLDPEHINGLNLYAYCANNPVMNVDPTGTWSWSKFWRTVATIAVAAVIAVATVALCIVTVGTAAPVLIGTGVGFALGMGMSAASQAITTGHVDIGKMFLDGIMGAISGAVAVTGIGLVGSMIVGGAIGGATSIGEDIIDGKSINAGKFFLSVGIGAIGGLISGSGADAKTLIGKDKYFKAVLKTAISPKKIAMYTAKQGGLVKNIVIAAIRFSASMVASHGVSKGLGLAFGW